MIQSLNHDTVSVRMQATPETVYALVSDVTRTPEFSPEILECTWLDGATGPAVGARFKARNKVANRPAWHNKPVVTVAEPGRRFSFARTEPFAGTVEWTYALEPDGDATLVTESYAVTKQLHPVGCSSSACYSPAKIGGPTLGKAWSRLCSGCASSPSNTETRKAGTRPWPEEGPRA